MAKKQKKLNSMRILEQHDIAYEALPYDSAERDAAGVAELLGVPEFLVYKTLIVQSVATEKPFIVMIESERRLNLKRMAAAAGEKKVKMALHADAEKMTGLQVGGISALMLLDKNWDIYLDSAATTHQHIYVSAGQRGLQLRVPVMPLMNLLRARLVDVSDTSE
ncbi:MAG: YbaK/EbsC family protein [Aggregatilineales bacterium]